jgi:hypothetical protein
MQFCSKNNLPAEIAEIRRLNALFSLLRVSAISAGLIKKPALNQAAFYKLHLAFPGYLMHCSLFCGSLRFLRE